MSRRPVGKRKVAEGVWRVPSGKLEIRWYEGTVGGKERQRTKVLPAGTSRQQAISERAQRMKVAARNRGDGTRDETVRSFYQRWLRDYARPVETSNMFLRQQTKRFVEDFGHRKPQSITRTEARLWASGGVCPPELYKTVKGWVGVEERDGELVAPPHRGLVKGVRTLFNDMVEDERVELERNVFAGLRLNQERGRADIVVLRENELEQLEAVAARTFRGSSFPAMIRFAAWTGLRPAELYALRWRDVDLERGLIHVQRQYRSKLTEETTYLKTDRARRDVVLLEPAEDALKSIPRRLDDDLIFRNLNGDRMTARTMGYYWKRVRDKFWPTLEPDRKCSLCAAGSEHQTHDGVPEELDFYELRHAFASHLAQLPGVTPMDVADQMGHSDGGRLAMRRYFHIESTSAQGRIRRGYERGRAEQAERDDEREAM